MPGKITIDGVRYEDTGGRVKYTVQLEATGLGKADFDLMQVLADQPSKAIADIIEDVGCRLPPGYKLRTIHALVGLVDGVGSRYEFAIYKPTQLSMSELLLKEDYVR